jgi:tetratricopeptide (TPR) repeat protein
MAVVRALDWADEHGVRSNELALVRGFLSLTYGDLVSAQAHADQVDVDDPLGRVLLARVALSRGQRTPMASAWTRIGGTGAADGPVLQLLALQALGAGMEEAETVAAVRDQLMSQHGDNPLVQLAFFEEKWDPTLQPSQALVKLSEAKDGVPRSLSPRQAGRFHMIRSSLTRAIGLESLAKDAWRRALLEDPSHPRYLYQAALEAVRENRLVAGEDDLRRCLEARPWDRDCRRGIIQVLIDLDRLQTARARVEGFAGPGVDVTDLLSWIMLAEGHPQDALDALGARGREGGVAAFVESMARADLNASEADAGLVAVATALAGTGDLLDRILAGRAAAARMRFVPRAQLRAVEAEAVRLAPNDPGVHVGLGYYSEHKGQRGDAADAYDLAARIGVESAVAHHARGLFYFDPRGDMTQARSAWARYLALQPDGARAERTKERMRLR